MRYQLELDIELPRERVIKLFLDPNNLPKWQTSLLSFEPLDAEKAREVGAKSKQIHKMGKSKVEMIETITVHNYPDEFSATYEADGVWNLVANRFYDINGNKTKWILNSECKFSGIAWLMAFFMPGMFKKQTLDCMNQFKQFAEKQAGA